MSQVTQYIKNEKQYHIIRIILKKIIKNRSNKTNVSISVIPIKRTTYPTTSRSHPPLKMLDLVVTKQEHIYISDGHLGVAKQWVRSSENPV